MNKEIYIKVYGEELDNSNCLYLDGVQNSTGDYVQLPGLGFSGTAVNITFEAWTKIDAFSGVMDIFCMDVNERFVVRYENGNYSKVGGIGVSGSAVGGVFTRMPNFYYNWVHIAVVYTYADKSFRVYGNGVLLNTIVCSEQIQFNTNVTAQFGTLQPAWYGYRYKGWIDEVRIWNVARSAQEIQDNFKRKLTGNESGLVAYYKMEQVSGTTLLDSTPNSRHATLLNFTGNYWVTTDRAPITRTVYKGFFYDFSLSSFTKSISSGVGELSISVPKKFDNFGEGDVIKMNNAVEAWVYDNDSPSGRKIYSGYIAEYTPAISTDESVEVRVLGFTAKLTLDILQYGGSYKFDYINVDPSFIVKDIVDKYRANNPGTPINYTASSIQNTGKSVTVHFDSEYYYKAIDTVRKLADANWYLYLDVDNIVYFKAIPTTATHKFMFERDITKIKMKKSIIEMRNGLLFWNGLISTDASYIAKYYSDANSIISYGRQIEVKRDERYKNAGSADNYGNRFVTTFKDPINTVTFSVVDNNLYLGYDTDSIQPGNTCMILNISANNALTTNMLITQVKQDFKSGEAEVTVADANAYITRTVYDLGEDLKNISYNNIGPASYS